MNIFKHEVKQYKITTLFWLLAMFFLLYLYTVIFADTEGSDSIAGYLEDLPEVLKKSIGLTSDTLGSFAGTYGTTLQLITLIAAIQASMIGIGISSKEVANKTADFLLTKPVSRTRVYLEKFTASFSLIAVTNLVLLAGAWLIQNQLYDASIPFSAFLKGSLTVFFVQLFFIVIGYLFGVVLPKVKSVVSIALPLTFAFYIIGILDTVIGETTVRFLTPFNAFDTSELLSGGSYSLGMLLYWVTIILALVVGGLVYYKNKDVHTV